MTVTTNSAIAHPTAYTLTDAAKAFGVSDRLLRQAINDPEYPVRLTVRYIGKGARSPRVTHSEMVRWLDAHADERGA